MAWAPIREATDEDMAAVEAAAERFIERHRIKADWGNSPHLGALDNPWEALESAIDRLDPRFGWAGYMRRLWRGCMRRALGEPRAHGIAYGYVGRSVE